MILPDCAVRIGKPVLLLGQPIRAIGAIFRDQVYLKSGLLENIEWMKRFGDKESGLLAFGVEGGMSRRDSNYSLAWGSHGKLRRLREEVGNLKRDIDIVCPFIL